MHVGDREDRVAENRRRLGAVLALPSGAALAEPGARRRSAARHTDRGASTRRPMRPWPSEPGQVCAVLTADAPAGCCSPTGGRRRSPWLMPAGAAWPPVSSSPQSRRLVCRRRSLWPGWDRRFRSRHSSERRGARRLSRELTEIRRCLHGECARPLPGRPVVRLARLALEQSGSGLRLRWWLVRRSASPERFFSYRRDGGRTGRSATVAWLA